LSLLLPDYREDLAGVVYLAATLAGLGVGPAGSFQFRLDFEPGAEYLVEKTVDLKAWALFLTVTNLSSSTLQFDPTAGTNGQGFFRARRN